MSCNTCTICLDSVIGVRPIGGAYPCGHVFHLECWDGWVASQHCRQAKCAMCNRPSEGFSRLYLDFLGTNDDNISLSSCSEADQGEEESSECERDEAETDTNHEDSAQQDVIVIHSGSIENATSIEEPSNSAGSAGIPKDGTDKYKKVARQLKQRNKYLAAQIIESNKAVEETKQSYEAECDKRLQFEKEIHSLKEQYKYAHLALSGANLEAAALKRQLAERESSLETTKASLDSIKATMEKLQKSYDESLKKARASSMAEVRQMLIDYPKVVQENRELKNRISAVESKQMSKAPSKESHEKPAASCLKRKIDLLKELDRKTSHKAANNVTDARADQREAEIQLCLQKSSCATALSRTLQAKRRRSPLDVLNNGCKSRHGIPPR
ncbi:hypothetical protein FisN_4Lh567 [Fistulifera solaris]|uniref:RING-type domain-containing protein n=1 Tax=Fistulifera solaris TaxID=1519565 RepID=A0A1Z5KDQ2_FISSO|nr:hypothetical protein FisN_4Lh567 [Fistulifera solaris]|eukprot:GAX24430.1 hypothetical protein FisN_4Lh567 [Fistulifera solaris]